MKLKYFILITIFVPTFVFASFGDRFNSLLENFFSGEEPVSAEEVLSVPEPTPPIISGEGPVDVKKAILQEEDSLQSIEEELRENTNVLFKIKDEHDLVQYQLEQLDSDLAIVRAMQEQRNKAVKKWQNELDIITQKKSEIDASVRHENRAQNELLSKKFIQSSLIKNNEGLNILQWIFSDKSISQLIEKQRRDQHIESSLQSRVKQLKRDQKQIAEEEQRIAAILLRVQELERQSARQQMLLADLLSARANVLARLEFSQGETENAIESARQQQVQATLVLQDLREKLNNDVSVKTPIQLTQKLAFPLKIEPKITAHFLDPEYKKMLGRDHFGTDFWAPQGTDIFAPMDGVIKKIAQNGYAYSYLIIDHGNDLFTLYGHISDAVVKEGEAVVRGQKIAETGGTPGLPGSGFFTTGAHLHFEVFAGGRHVDAEKWLSR